MHTALDSWFSKVKRPFPWRNDPSPYMVLVSEVMLQQTQASRVQLYFHKWMHLFPSLESLAQAPEEALIKAWEGLGYYSRVRSLHKAAKTLVAQYKGRIPQNREELLLIPGIGPYTAGAILCFAFHKRALAIDANVERVLRRVYQISYTNKNARKLIETHLESLLPQENAWHTMEALIELGALVCQKNPSCSTCPLSLFCLSYKNGVEAPPPRKLATSLFRDVACILVGEEILVVHRSGKQIMSGLYEFPFFDSVKEGRERHSLSNFLKTQLPVSFTLEEKLPSVTHSFTQFRSHLYPWILFSQEKFSWPDGKWVSLDDLEQLPFSSGHKRISAQLHKYIQPVTFQV